MKVSNVILSFSLIANVALATAVLLGNRSTAAADFLKNRSAFEEGSSERSIAPRTETGRRAHVPAWNRLNSEDLEELVSRLRAAGFPTSTTRAIAMVWSAERTAARQRTILGERKNTPYWLAQTVSELDREHQAAFAKIMAADQAVFRRLFLSADAIGEDPAIAAQFRNRFGDLPLTRLQQLARIDEDYNELIQKITLSGRNLTDEDRKQLAMLDEEHRRDLRSTMSQEEYEQFQLRSGQVAFALRWELDAFRPAEEEFKALVALLQTVEDSFPSRWQTHPEKAAARARSLEAIQPQIEAALGPERYADFLQAVQEGSQRVNTLLVRLDLPLRTGGQIEEMRKDLTQRAEVVRTDASLTPAERAVRLTALEREARQRVGATLGGERNLAAYEDIKGWIRDLRPKAAQ